MDWPLGVRGVGGQCDVRSHPHQPGQAEGRDSLPSSISPAPCVLRYWEGLKPPIRSRQSWTDLSVLPA